MGRVGNTLRGRFGILNRRKGERRKRQVGIQMPDGTLRVDGLDYRAFEKPRPKGTSIGIIPRDEPGKLIVEDRRAKPVGVDDVPLYIRRGGKLVGNPDRRQKKPNK